MTTPEEILDSIMLGHVQTAIGHLEAATACFWGSGVRENYDIIKKAIKELKEVT